MKPKVITSLKNPLIQTLLGVKKRAKSAGELFLVDGWHLVEMGRNAGILEGLLLLEAAPDYDEIPQYLVNQAIIDKLKNVKTNPGVIGILKRKMRPVVGGTHFLVLDRIQDPGNMGNLLRSALAFNYDGVLLTKGCVDIFHPKVLAATQGAFFFLPTKEIELEDLKALQEEGFELVVSTLERATKLEAVEPPDLLLLVVGNEGAGVDDKIAAMADILVKIPISEVDSLNAASAGAILLYYFRPNADSGL
ncbi:MAG: TrmH family RNA methyltransferase [Syntrophomonadaceae bacterium]|jgi:TrmH family RNA methyltransferase